MLVRLLYFASVREGVGMAEEALDVPPTWRRSGRWSTGSGRPARRINAAFADRTRLRAAVDGQFVPLDAELGEPAEVALFPPVTGG